MPEADHRTVEQMLAKIKQAEGDARPQTSRYPGLSELNRG